MPLADLVASQLRLPHGILAPFAARTLNRRNRQLIASAIDGLGVRAGQSVLDVGFGGALSLELLLQRVGEGRVAGVDPSVAMVQRARRRLVWDVPEGRLVLKVGSADALPFDDHEFDRVLTSQTVYFWGDVGAGLAELHRVLVPGGRCAVAMIPRPLQERHGFVERGYNVLSHTDLGLWLSLSGFERIVPCGPGSGPRWVLVASKK